MKNKLMPLALLFTLALNAQCKGRLVPENVENFNYSFTQAEFEKFWRKETTTNNTYEIRTTSKGGRLNDGYLMTETNGTGERKKPKRAEYGFNLCDSIGDSRFLSISFKIPKDKFAFSKENLGREVMIFQYHSKPEEDQDWNYYRKNLKFNRPSVALYLITHDNKNYYAFLRYGNNGKDKFEFKGWKWSTVGMRKVEVDKWQDLTVQTYWSDNNTGFVAAWLNNKPLTPFNGLHNRAYGPNMHNRAPNYFKFGQYRYFDEKNKMQLYFDELRIGNTYKEVSLYKELPTHFAEEKKASKLVVNSQ